MAGFTIVCNDCGNKISTGDDYRAKNERISLFSEVRRYGTAEEYIEKTLWCENCGNNTEFEEANA